MKPSYKLTGEEELARTLKKLSRARYKAVIMKQVVQIYNRGRRNLVGGTPRRTGELRNSLTKDKTTVGYTKEYAPHVEYGHRTKNGGYVQGQYFLKQNMEKQTEIFNRDMRREIKRLTEGKE